MGSIYPRLPNVPGASYQATADKIGLGLAALTGAGIAAHAIVRGIKDEALDWQRDVIRMQALLGAKNPHPQTFLVGGMSIPKEVTDGVLKKL